MRFLPNVTQCCQISREKQAARCKVAPEQWPAPSHKLIYFKENKTGSFIDNKKQKAHSIKTVLSTFTSTRIHFLCAFWFVWLIRLDPSITLCMAGCVYGGLQLTHCPIWLSKSDSRKCQLQDKCWSSYALVSACSWFWGVYTVCVVTQVLLFSLDYDMYQCPVYSWHCLTATLYS